MLSFRELLQILSPERIVSKAAPLRLFPERHRRILYYTVPLLAIVALSLMVQTFSINRRVINEAQLWDMAGRPYETFLYELNMPRSMGAVFIAGTPDRLVKTEEYYEKYNVGDIFTSQLRSLLFGTEITEYSIASGINFMFGVSAILFSVLVGYLIFNNGYVSVVVFLFIMIFRDSCQGLIYGLPVRHTYAVFNPLLASCIVISVIMFLKNGGRKYWPVFILSGFAIAYIEHCRTSEGRIVVVSLAILTALISLEGLRTRGRDFRKTLICILIMLLTVGGGYFGYFKMVTAFENHRDKKFNLTVTDGKVLSSQPAFHSLFISLFRYPNKFNRSFLDTTGYNAVYEKYPELKKKFIHDTNYIELVASEEYNTAIREIYRDFVFNNPGYFFTFLARSAYDYFLFLPYYSWTGDRSAHAYMPKINRDVKIEPGDLAPFSKGKPFASILNLRLGYLPESPLFWIYFVCAYVILVEAVYTSFVWFRRHGNNETAGSNLPIYLLWGMLIYFFFASIVRILIPVHGQGAVVAFNILVIYNLVRLSVSAGVVEWKNIKTPAWLLLLVVLSLYPVTTRGLEIFRRPAPPAHPPAPPHFFETPIAVSGLNGEFEGCTDGWKAYQSSLRSTGGGQSGNCLQVTTTEDTTGYAYTAISTEVGVTYELTAFFRRGTTENGQIKIGTSIDVADLYYSGVLSDMGWAEYKGTFKAVTPMTYITLVNLTSIKGKTAFFDAVTFRRVDAGEDRQRDHN